MHRYFLINLKKRQYLLSQVLLSRYAEEVVSCIRFLVFHAILLGTFVLTLCGIVLIIVSGETDTTTISHDILYGLTAANSVNRIRH